MLLLFSLSMEEADREKVNDEFLQVAAASLVLKMGANRVPDVAI